MITAYFDSLRRFNRDVRLVLASSALIGFTVFGGIYSVLVNLYLLRLGYGPQFIGQVNAAAAISFATISLPAGLIGQRWGTRRCLILGMILAASGFFLLPLAEFIHPSRREAWLMGANALGVAGMSLYLVNGAPYLTGRAAPPLRSYVFSTMVALWPLAGFAGSLVGGFLPELFSELLDIPIDHPVPYRYPLLVAAGLLWIAVAALLFTREADSSETQEEIAGARPFPFALIAVLTLVTFFHMTAESSTRTFFNVYMDDELHISTSLIGSLVAAGQILAFATALTAPHLSARWGRSRTIVWGAAGMSVAMLPLALIPHWVAAGLSSMLLIAAASVRRSVFILFQQELVSPRWRVAINSILTSSFGISSASIALSGGYLITTLGYRILFLATATLTGVGTLIFWVYFRKPRGEYALQREKGRAG